MITLSQIIDQISSNFLTESNGKKLFTTYNSFLEKNPIIKEVNNIYNNFMSKHVVNESLSLYYIESNIENIVKNYDKSKYIEARKKLDEFYTSNNGNSDFKSDLSVALDALILESYNNVSNVNKKFDSIVVIVEQLKKNKKLTESEKKQISKKKEKIKNTLDSLNENEKKIFDVFLFQDEERKKILYSELINEFKDKLNSKLKYENLDSETRNVLIESEKKILDEEYNDSKTVDDFSVLIELINELDA